MRITSLSLALALSATLYAGQAPPPGSPPPATEIDQIVARVLEANTAYVQTFRSLVAEETKDIEQFDKAGRVTKRRRIVADLLIYQPARGAAKPVEYRDTQTVDGKPVKGRSERALALIQRAMRAESLERELQVIDRENQRYDLNYRVIDTTINQGVPAPGPAFGSDYLIEWVGREQVNGHDTVVLDYRARSSKPEKNSFTENLGANAVTIRGRFWADASTFQLRRDRFELLALNPALPEPPVFLRREATYGESRFGILTPQRVVAEWFERTGGTKPKPSMTLAARLTFTYGAFRRFEVATEETLTTPR